MDKMFNKDEEIGCLLETFYSPSYNFIIQGITNIYYKYYQHRLSLPSYWGDGTTSSSDGMRVQVGVSSLISEHNPHYGSGKGSTIYRFVSDQYSTFYTKVINTNAREAVHVIDGLLEHETDLCINEHYTDTAGYTDQVFGLSHLLGFVFAPRIRDISD